ncbi:MAG: hypothetical protein WDO73_13200 [Ignavibacteriota bacterium]
MEFRLGIGMGCGGAEFEAFRVEWLLNRSPAGSVIESGSQRQAGALAQWIDALYESLTVADFTDDGGAVVILQCA